MASQLSISYPYEITQFLLFSDAVMLSTLEMRKRRPAKVRDVFKVTELRISTMGIECKVDVLSSISAGRKPAKRYPLFGTPVSL